MYFKEIKKLLENKIAPKDFRLTPEGYGIQYGTIEEQKEIKRIMVTLDLSIDAIHFAITNKIKLIISRYGLVNNPISHFNDIMIKKLTLLTKYPVLIFALNSPFIAVEGGISDIIMNSLYLQLDRPFNILSQTGEEIPIGRICLPQAYPDQKDSLNLRTLVERIRTFLNTNRIPYLGDLDKVLKRICIVPIDSLSISYLERVQKEGCDCLITGKVNCSEALFARDIGLFIIEISLFQCEIIALKKLCNLLSLEFPHEEFMMFDSIDPFSYV